MVTQGNFTMGQATVNISSLTDDSLEDEETIGLNLTLNNADFLALSNRSYARVTLVDATGKCQHSSVRYA